MDKIVQNIPGHLIYEMVEGKPVYYKGYKKFMEGNVRLEELMGSSYLQSLIISKLVFLLMSGLNDKYTVLTNEIGLQFKEKSWRAADIAIFESKKLQGIEKGNKCLTVAPKIVIEIDTKAEIEEVNDSFGYFHQKTDELLNFGVEKVFWIFTDSQKVMIAEKDKDWQILNWAKDIAVLENVAVNIQSLIDASK